MDSYFSQTNYWVNTKQASILRQWKGWFTTSTLCAVGYLSHKNDFWAAAEEAGKEQDDDNHLREKIVPAIATTEIRDLKVSLCHLKTATADELVLTKHQTRIPKYVITFQTPARLWFFETLMCLKISWPAACTIKWWIPSNHIGLVLPSREFYGIWLSSSQDLDPFLD